MKTGDLVLFTESKKFSEWWILDKVVTYFTKAPWVHVGIVLKDPEWLGLKGLYLWESAWTGLLDSVDKNKKFGVQVVPLEDRIVKGSTFHRSFEGKSFNMRKMKQVYRLVHDKSYDVHPFDWIEAYLQRDFKPQKTDRFWCSSFVACVLTKMRLLPPDTDWSIVEPKFFADSMGDSYGALRRI